MFCVDNVGFFQKPVSAKPAKPGKASGKSRRKSRVARKYAVSESEVDTNVSDAEEEIQQCYGLECLNAARRGSKYCSDECGVKLATERLYMVLLKSLISLSKRMGELFYD
jgi:COMPASS component SPP1